MTKLQLCGRTLCLPLAVACGPAFAQTRGPAADAAEIEQEEIVVTAQKRTQDLIDVPQSVTVMSGGTLQRQQATNFQAFARNVADSAGRTSTSGLGAFPNGAIETGVIRPRTFGLTVGTGF